MTPTGEPANYCGYCGFTFHANAWKKWLVTLRDGETHEVDAINEWHAGSVVVYGNGAAAIDGRTGQVVGVVKVHRGNIMSINPVQDGSQPAIEIDADRANETDKDGR